MRIAGVLFAVLSVWQGFSNQSAFPWYLNFVPHRMVQARLGLLHVSATVGVPSFSGHPTNGMSCTQARAYALPQARALVTARAAAFAHDLGVRIIRIYKPDPTPTPAPPPPPGVMYLNCGMPKFGLPPVSASTGATFAMTPLVLRWHAVSSPSPTPSSTPFPFPTFAPPYTPSAMLRAMVISVSAAGTATLPADRISVTLDIQPPTPTSPASPNGIGPNSDADIQPILDLVRRDFPSATVSTRYDLMHYGVNRTGTIVVNQYRAEVTLQIPAPDAKEFASFGDVITGQVQSLGYTLQARTLPLLDSCEALEDAARRDAIANAQTQAMRESSRMKRLRLIFADEQPLQASSICGPIIDPSWATGALGFLRPQVSGNVRVTLEFVAN